MIQLDDQLVQKTKQLAQTIIQPIQRFVQTHTTLSIERTAARYMGVDGEDSDGTPFPNVMIDHLYQKKVLGHGASFWIANGCIQKRCEPQQLAIAVADGLDLTSVPIMPKNEIDDYLEGFAQMAIDRILSIRDERNQMLHDLGDPLRPLRYVIVATGNIHEDTQQAKAAVTQGADVIAVIRSTAQSLLEYVPYGATTEGFGGTYASQENFRIMRRALDESGKEAGRYIRLVNYASGLCMPEIAMMASWEGLDFLLNDSMYGILFRDINMKRTLIDQYFSRMICALAHITINTGEDNYLTTSDAIEKAYAVTASQLINEAFAKAAGMEERFMGLGHAFEIDPDIENGFLYELAHALLTRQLFPYATPKYMPPTKYMTGNIFKGFIMNAMFNLAAILTGQDIQLLGMPTEAIHTPYLQDRYLALTNANYIFGTARGLKEEIQIKSGGWIEQRANEVLAQALNLLEHTAEVGLMKAIEEGQFADISRPRDGGKGLEGVIIKEDSYCNPFFDKIESMLLPAGAHHD